MLLRHAVSTIDAPDSIDNARYGDRVLLCIADMQARAKGGSDARRQVFKELFRRTRTYGEGPITFTTSSSIYVLHDLASSCAEGLEFLTIMHGACGFYGPGFQAGSVMGASIELRELMGIVEGKIAVLNKARFHVEYKSFARSRNEWLAIVNEWRKR